jgi:hypothetical protein
VSPGSVFTIGTFTLTNGGWFGNSPSNGPDFSLAEDADYFCFLNHPVLGTMSVIEAVDAAGNPTSGNVGTVS